MKLVTSVRLTLLISILFGLTKLVYAESSSDEVDLIRAGGDTTVELSNNRAFNTPASNILKQPILGELYSHDLQFLSGNAVFRDPWVEVGASLKSRDGLGPQFNARSCEACHVQDGRGRPPLPSDPPNRIAGLLFRIKVAGNKGDAQNFGGMGHPWFGGQLQDLSLPGLPVEGVMKTQWQPVNGKFADGTPWELRQPIYTLYRNDNDVPVDDIIISPRVATKIAGTGLLENALVDAKGRLGWKSEQRTVRQQNAAAFNGDLGITSSLFPNENCGVEQEVCLSKPSGGTPELSDKQLDRVTAYVKLLGVPARRDRDDPQVQQGEALFKEIGCESCHQQFQVTGIDPKFPELSNQKISPWTDLQVHDMGAGLQDQGAETPEDLKEAVRWRTPPLWGIGLVETVNNHTFFLHDGRARSLEEAILWHGGEGLESNTNYQKLAATDRSAVLRFLQSL